MRFGNEVWVGVALRLGDENADLRVWSPEKDTVLFKSNDQCRGIHRLTILCRDLLNTIAVG